MSWADTLKNILGYVTGEALIGTIENIQDRIDETTRKVIKASVLYVLFIIGVLFILVGLSKFLDASMLWTTGTGAMIIGGVLIILGIVAKALR